MGRAVVYINL